MEENKNSNILIKNDSESLYLFVIWDKSRNKTDLIIEDLKKKFIIKQIYEIEWDKTEFVDNLTRIYGSKSTASDKGKLLGTGPFLLILVSDKDPKFIEQETPKGTDMINTNILKSKAFFLDRDGVINKEIGYLLNYKKFKFLSGVKKGIKYLNKKNYLVIVITNQSPVGRSILKETELKKIHSKMKKDIFTFSGGIIDDIFYSPYYRYSKIKKYRKNYIDRKPNNGMLNKAIDKWCIDVNKSKFMGDQTTDKKCSEKSKIKFYYKKNINFYDQIKNIIQ